METKVTAGHVKWIFPNKIVLDDVEIMDQSGDSLIYVEKLQTRIRHIDLENQIFSFGTVHLQRPVVKFNSQDGIAGMNYMFLTELGGGSGGGKAVQLLFKKIILSNGTFEYRRDDVLAPSDRRFNENHLRFDRINAELLSMDIIADSLNFKIKEMSAKEHSGLELKHLACKAKIHFNGMEFDELLLRTNESSIEHYLSFEYKGYPMMGDFIDSVQVRSNLENTILSMNDLAFFSDQLKEYAHEELKLSGNFKGTVANFKANDLKVEFGEDGKLLGEAKVKGLPEWDISYVDVDVEQLTSSIAGIERIAGVKFPVEVHRLGTTNFKGYVTGFYSNFVADGNLNSSLGRVKTRIQIEQLPSGITRYNGKVLTSSFQMGTLLGVSDLGKISMTVDVKDASGTSLEDLKAKVIAEVQTIEYLGRTFVNVSANGKFSSGGFDGFASVNDPELKLDFNGNMDFRGAFPKYNFKSKIKRANLLVFGLDTTKSLVSGEFDVNLKGRSLDQINGLISARDVKLLRDGESYQLNNLFVSSGYKEKERSIIMRSDFADVNLKGNFKFSQLDRVYADFLNTLFPDYYTNDKPVQEAIVITADAKIRQDDLLDLIMPYGIELGNGTFEGNYRAKEKSLAVDGRMDEIIYQEFKLKNYFLNIRKNPFELLNMATDIDEVLRNDSAFVHTVELNASILPNDVDFMLNVSDTSDLLALRSFGRLKFKNDSIQLQLEQSKIYSKGRRWTINDKNKLLFTKTMSLVEMLELNSGEESAFVSGRLGSRDDQKLSVWLSRFQLSNLNPILEMENINLSGYANGSVDIHQVLNRPLVKANLLVDDLVYNGDTLGNFKIISTANEHPLAMDIVASIEEGIFKNLTIKGKVDWRENRDNFDVNLVLRDGSVKPFEQIFKGLASGFKGSVDSRLRLTGTFDDPIIAGHVTLKKVSFKVDYLQTRYTLNDRVRISQSIIDLNDVNISDQEGHQAKAKGVIKHELFDNFVLDLSVVEAKSILAMNTTKKDNELFYGKAYGSGSVQFKGPLDDIYININASSDKGTKIFIPVYSTGENALVDYVSFVDQSNVVVKRGNRQVEGITMDMKFKITEEAEFELLFDELLDDKIYGRGFGSVKIEMNTYGDFFMFGDFEISEGYYPFASPMLVSEKFVLKKGGKIRWDGDPYNAYIDMEAKIRRSQANPYHLMLGSPFVADNKEKYQGEVDVDVQLFLRGELFNPDITFGLSLPNNSSISGNSEFLSVFNRVKADEDELNRQVFSLMTFGSFSPTNFFAYDNVGFASNIGQTVNNSLSSFISGQLNNWISQYNQNWEIGVDWQTQNAEQNAELILSVRKKLFNDRLEIAGSVDAVTNSAGKNPYDVNLIYNVKEDGKIRIKAFQKMANDPTLGDINNITTTGFGLFFRMQFDRIRLRRKNKTEVSGLKPASKL